MKVSLLRYIGIRSSGQQILMPLHEVRECYVNKDYVSSLNANNYTLTVNIRLSDLSDGNDDRIIQVEFIVITT